MLTPIQSQKQERAMRTSTKTPSPKPRSRRWRTPDPRLKEIMDAAVRHLHAFAREVRLTPANG